MSTPGTQRSTSRPYSHCTADPVPLAEFNQLKVGEVTLRFCSPDISPKQRRQIVKILASWPEEQMEELAPSNILQIFSLPRNDFSKLRRQTDLGRDGYLSRYPNHRRPLPAQTATWKSGKIYLQEAKQLGEDPRSLTEALEPVQLDIAEILYKEARIESTQNPIALIPTDVSTAGESLQDFITYGAELNASQFMNGDLGIIQSSDSFGRSIHQLRLRITNPWVNDWVEDAFADEVTEQLIQEDPSILVYLGAFVTAETTPFGALAELSSGVDFRIVDLSGFDIFVDTNMQYRVHSDSSVPSEGVEMQFTPHITSTDEKISLGMSLTSSLFPADRFNASFTSSIAME